MDEDMFALSDDELPISTSKCNPVEEHLMKQLSDVQTRIQKTKNDIKEIQDMTKHALESLYNQALYGKNITLDCDSDLYTIDGQPVIKKIKHKSDSCEYMVIKSNWKYIFSDKWVIGIELMNNSEKTLSNPQIYVSLKDNDELYGISMFWKLVNEIFSYRIDKIQPNSYVMATVVLNVPKFDKNPFCDVYGTISYKIEENEYQIPIPVIRLTIEDTIDNNYQIKFLTERNYAFQVETKDILPMILALRSTSVEKIIDVQIKKIPKKEKEFLTFLKEKSFEAIFENIYIVQTTSCLMHCLIEILPIIEGEEKLRISSRSNHQMNIILRFLKDHFSDMIIEEDVNPFHAAMVLMNELKLYLEDTSTAERQMARIRTDLLIP